MQTAFNVLLIEDNPGDALFIKEGFKKGRVPVNIKVVEDGDEALEYLRDRKNDIPDLILLDLNLPRVDGFTVLSEIKADPSLCRIPVIILTSSGASSDIQKSYDNHANSYLVKPIGLDQMMGMVGQIEQFWFGLAKLAPKNG